MVVAGGPIAGAAGQGRRPDAGVWRSTDGGLTWKPVTLPASHGATAGLAGVAASGTGFVAVRPGHAAGRQDAVTYQSAQGATWRYAGKLTPVRRTSLQVTEVSGSSHGYVVAASVQGSQVAFSSARGRDWHQTAAGAGAGVAGLTAGPGGAVVVAGNSEPGTGAAGIRPHLILISPDRRAPAGRPGDPGRGATPDVTVNGLAAGGRTLVAAGAAGGSPALWLGSAGQWAPAGVLLPRRGATAHWLAWRTAARAGWRSARPGSPRPPSAQAPVPRCHPRPAGDPDLGHRHLLDPGGRAPPAHRCRERPGAGGGRPGRLRGGWRGQRRRPGLLRTAPAAWYSKDLSTWARAPLPVPAAIRRPGRPGAARCSR